MEIKLNKKQKVKISSSKDIYLIMRQILRRENKISQSQEHFWLVGLNQANKILYIELVALGSSNMTNIKPREAFRLAIHKLAVQVVMVHNHPSGEVAPSVMDKDFTDHFIQAGQFLKVEVVDHLIISDKTYYSFVDSGVFAELRASKKWVLPFELEENARSEGIEIGEEKGRKEEKIEMAKLMKKDKKSTEEIQKYTQLSLEEIQKL